MLEVLYQFTINNKVNGPIDYIATAQYNIDNQLILSINAHGSGTVGELEVEIDMTEEIKQTLIDLERLAKCIEIKSHMNNNQFLFYKLKYVQITIFRYILTEKSC